LAFAVSSSVVTDSTVNKEFQLRSLFDAWKADHNKVYESDEVHELRWNAWRQNFDIVEALNAENNGAKFAMNQFADMTHEEFSLKKKGFKPSFGEDFVARREMASSEPTLFAGAVSPKDWRNTGATSPVKDQGQCGSCWAFSATQAVESATFLKTGSLPILAPQQIVDCDHVDGGCNGGDTPTAYNYVVKAGGQETEANYPYTAKDGACKFSASKVAATISSFKYVDGLSKPCNDKCTDNDVNAMKTALSSSPVSICVDATSAWQSYQSGIYKPGLIPCGAQYNQLDHCVHLVGWGTENSVDYWIVKNSWGTTWGEKGYMRIVADSHNYCGILDEATIAIA